MNKKLSMKLLLAGSLVITGLFGTMISAPSQASAATPESLQVIASGKEHIGTPYRYGAPAGITYAFDCSSFVQYVFNQFGVDLPRTSISQAYTGQKVDKAYLSVGDLVFFNTSGSGISHVGIYAGNGKMLHASSKKGITLSNMNSTYYSNKFVTARRVL
jgi:cell wall-associated NlpC family hydrolase